ncbi:MAG: DUF2521 family protein [Bacilli bacterium]
MHDVVDINEKRREVQLRFERTMLKEIRFIDLKKDALEMLKQWDAIGGIEENQMFKLILERGVEAFLVGAQVSKFGTRGESKERCHDRVWIERLLLKNEIIVMIETLLGNEHLPSKMLAAVEQFVDLWVSTGYEQGYRKYKLKMI